VQDGVRGDIVNTSTRKYEKKFFGLYKSHTKGAEGIEGGSSDVVPIWRRWPVVAAALVMPIGVIMFAMAPPIFPDQSKANAAMLAAAKSAPKIVPEVIKPNVEAVQSAAVNVVSATPPAAAKAEAKTEEPMDPYGGKGIHYQGKMSIGGKLIHLFGVSQGSAMITSVTSDELERAGYRVRIVGDCTGWIYYGKTERPVVCDSGAMVVGGTPAIRQGKAPEGSPAGGGAGDNTAKSETPRTASRPAPPRPGSAS
jgi:zona occludens toxin